MLPRPFYKRKIRPLHKLKIPKFETKQEKYFYGDTYTEQKKKGIILVM